MSISPKQEHWLKTVFDDPDIRFDADIYNSFTLPSGDTATRPAVTHAGMIRYNTDLGALEISTSSGNWVTLTANISSSPNATGLITPLPGTTVGEDFVFLSQDGALMINDGPSAVIPINNNQSGLEAVGFTTINDFIEAEPPTINDFVSAMDAALA